tara:strand:+ start:532 stop:951 length:420 start_codon:yes stop_codon:yes gene_type:complete
VDDKIFALWILNSWKNCGGRYGFTQLAKMPSRIEHLRTGCIYADNSRNLLAQFFLFLGLAILMRPTILAQMDSILQTIPVAVVVLMIALVVILFLGLGGMALGGRITPMARNKLMRVRVYLQGLIVLLVLITFAAAALK